MRMNIGQCSTEDDRMSEMDEDLQQIRQRKLKELMAEKGADGVATNNKPMEVTDANFEETLKKHSLVVIDCWAPWCGPCQMVGPIIEALAEEHAGRILFGKLNVDDGPKTANKFGIMSIPTILIFKNGTLVDQQIGAMPKEVLSQAVAKHL
jgi:thioredoxin 1